MITGRQVRAARALLNWKQEMLAEKALVALTALKTPGVRTRPPGAGGEHAIKFVVRSRPPAFCSSTPIAGRGVMLLNETPSQPAPRAARMRA